jgi:Trypsin-like peptidase domain
MRTFTAVVIAAIGLVLAAGIMPAASQSRSVARVNGTGATMTLKAYRKAKQLSADDMRGTVGATGRLTCPWGTATAFLAGGSDTFVTSAHVFINLEQGASRPSHGHKKRPVQYGARLGSPGKCSIRFLMDDQRYKVLVADLKLGVQYAPFGPFWPSLDWAVGRLDRPVTGVRPYPVAIAPVTAGAPVRVISQGMADFTPRVCDGTVTSFVGVGRGSGFTTTCDVGLGSSGGPILYNGEIVGLTRGWIDVQGDGRGREHLGLAVDAGLLATLTIRQQQASR